MIADRIDISYRKTWRWGAGLCLAGIVGTFGGAALNSGAYFLGIMIGLIGALLLATQPLGLAVSAGLRDPWLLPDRVRIGAALGGVMALWIGVRVVLAGARVEHGLVLGGVILGTGAIGVAAAVRSPRPVSWKPPGAVVLGVVVTLMFAGLPRMFRGTKEPAYHHAMETAAQEIWSYEVALFADSGHYTTRIDTSAISGLRYTMAIPHIELTPDGFRVRTTSQLLTARYFCGVYRGSVAEPPATVPDRVTCVPYPDGDLALLADAWGLMVVVTGVMGLAMRRRALTASAAESQGELS
jgi:hypothetical protein